MRKCAGLMVMPISPGMSINHSVAGLERHKVCSLVYVLVAGRLSPALHCDRRNVRRVRKLCVGRPNALFLSHHVGGTQSCSRCRGQGFFCTLGLDFVLRTRPGVCFKTKMGACSRKQAAWRTSTERRSGERAVAEGPSSLDPCERRSPCLRPPALTPGEGTAGTTITTSTTRTSSASGNTSPTTTTSATRATSTTRIHSYYWYHRYYSYY